jgi:hypothetical protein
VSTDLRQLLFSIEPERTLNQTAERADVALELFQLPNERIKDWYRYEACMAEFFCHVENMVLRVNPPLEVNQWMHWGRCIEFLRAEYGADGEQAAFDIVRTGAEGGLYAVLRAVAARMGEWYADNEIKSKVVGYLNRLSAEETLEAMDEYLRVFGHLLPGELTEGAAVRIRANFYKVLCQHPRLVQRHRRVGR